MAKHLLELLFIWADSPWIKVKIIIFLENNCNILIKTFCVIGTIWIRFLARAMILLFATISRPALKSTQPLSSDTSSLFPGCKGTECEMITHLQLEYPYLYGLHLSTKTSLPYPFQTFILKSFVYQLSIRIVLESSIT